MDRFPSARFRTRVCALLALGLGPARAVTFGGLTISPKGPQNLNLDSGVTQFPQGGSATDSKGGLKLVAQSMELRPGVSLLAQGATVTTQQGGTLRADLVKYDLKAATVLATGNVSYSDSRFRGLSAAQLTIYVNTGFVAATGSVRADSPALNGRSLVFDAATQQAILTGPYHARQGTLNASGDATERLLMVFSSSRVVRSSTAPDVASVARFLPYLK